MRAYMCEPAAFGKEDVMKFSALFIAGLGVAIAGLHAQAIDDAQIAAIVVTANQVDVDAGKLARERAGNAEVKAFARQMVNDHEGVNTQAVALARKLGLTPKESETSRAIRTGGDRNLATLKTLSGAAFDKAYVDHEVVYHAQVLDAIDTTLIPGASNGELKALLVKVRPAFVAHLAHAKQIQAVLGSNRRGHR
jgi:putative membrane protein